MPTNHRRVPAQRMEHVCASVDMAPGSRGKGITWAHALAYQGSCRSFFRLFWSGPGYSADRPRVVDLAPDLAPVREKYDFPALAAAVIVDGQLQALGVVGVRKHGSDIKAEPNDPFHLGSCTKAMTGTLVGLLVQQGKLKWDTPLVEYFPQWKDTMHPDYRGVTLVHLMSHRAGVPPMTNGFAPLTAAAGSANPPDALARRPAQTDGRDRPEPAPHQQAGREVRILECRRFHRRGHCGPGDGGGV